MRSNWRGHSSLRPVMPTDGEPEPDVMRVMLICKACGTRFGPAFVTATIDGDGDLAVPHGQVCWFFEAHYLPVILSV